ncbi:DUF4179 domain-containing protein [Evansella tamaricis]|uniref:DUF4179 domain-containing protein n=1 Tax=Evansella tamaricis TaxID=2069301 RepID=A0ABS6JHR8_9BACI|nr:DUF4179 domain-containing protein [Evansella tamaricis]MBU9713215.1 DUF4179 domain-containing protein [Evansella tamaricis]
MKNNIKKELERIEIPEELQARSRLGILQAKSEKPKRKLKKVALSLVASTVILFSAGVGAAHIPSFNNLVSNVNPELALMLQPIEKSSESNGIRAEVVGGISDNEMAVIYITLQDLTGSRIHETLDIYDYSLTGAQMLSSQIIDFDEVTNTATLRIHAIGGKGLSDSKVNFRIDSFLSHKETFEPSVNGDISELKSIVPETLSLDMNNILGGGGKLYHQLSKEGNVHVLKPNQNIISLPGIDFMHISNVGIIDNRLHIQANWTENGMDDHGYFYFIDKNGNEVHPSNIYFGTDDSGATNYGREFTEYIFSIDNIDLENDKLMGYFVSSEKFLTGNWNATFRIPATGEEKTTDFNQEFETWTSDTVSISPLGITIYGIGEFNHSSNVEVNATMTDGSSLAFDSIRSFSDNDRITVKFLPDRILDISKIQSVNINGIDIFNE